MKIFNNRLADDTDPSTSRRQARLRGRRTMLSVAVVTLLAPVSWGTTYVTITELLPAGRPMFVALVRVLPAGLLLAAIGTVRSRWWPTRAEWLRLTTLAVFNFGLFFPLLIAGIYRLPGGVAASVGGLQPLLVTGIAWAASRRRIAPLEAVIGVVAAAGVALVVVRPGAGFDLVGVAAAIGANVSFAIGVVATKATPAPPDRLAATGWQLVIAAVMLAPVALIVEGAPPQVSVANAAAFAYLSVLATGVAFALWFRGIERLPVPAPPLLGLAAPVTGAALGWLLLGEDLTPLQLLGFAVTIGSITYGATGGSAGEDVTPDRLRRTLGRRRRPATC